MGLDIYVGSLTRYHTKNWQTKLQQLGPQAGITVQVVRLGGPAAQKPPSAEVVRPAVEQWRNNLAQALKQPLQWSESDDTPYFTDQATWNAYGAVLLLAAYLENPSEKMPETMPGGWQQDKVLAACKAKASAKNTSIRYGQLYFPEFWFPVNFPFVFKAQYVTKNEMSFGSATALLALLGQINEVAFKASREEIRQWRRKDGAGSGTPFQSTAKFGLSILMELAEQSVLHRLPMKLDY
jgi:hypothetical protein